MFLRPDIIKTALQISTTEQGPWKTQSPISCDVHLHGIAFAELVTFMEDLQKEALNLCSN